MTYEEIIGQTYISPIRSVIAVDDEFPTLDHIYGALVKSADAEEDAEQGVSINITAKEVARANELLKYCREQQWMVDVHDGKGLSVKDDEDGLVSHLHQTDLLILDYQLEGEAKGGDAAIGILRSLVKNKHFNLVVVYTKNDIAKTFREIMLGLLGPSGASLSDGVARAISDSWDDWGDDDSSAMAPFRELVDEASYIRWRARGAKTDETSFGYCFPTFENFSAVLEPKIAALDDGVEFAPRDVLLWLLIEMEKKCEPAMASDGLEIFDCGWEVGGDANWIWTESLYVTVISKRDVEAVQLIGELKRSLCGWRPSPHHIILSKMRALLEESGGEIEAKALRDQHVQAGLLWELLEPEEPPRETLISRVLDRQWGQVLDVMKEKVIPEGLALLDTVSLEGETRAETVNRYYPDVFDAKTYQTNLEVWLKLNSYWSSMPPTGHHLGTGHIFEFENSHWICLSPLCDLVPEQNHTVRWRERLGAELHFKAVKLHPVSEKDALKYATSGACIYLRIENELKTFAYSDPSKREASPDWEQMFAIDGGKFLDGRQFKLSVVRNDLGKLVVREPEIVTVVGQLRYEYALNLLQRLGSTLSRVGLDFVRPN